MAEMVGKGEIHRYYEFTDQIATENARVEVTFSIDEGHVKD